MIWYIQWTLLIRLILEQAQSECYGVLLLNESYRRSEQKIQNTYAFYFITYLAFILIYLKHTYYTLCYSGKNEKIMIKHIHKTLLSMHWN